MRIAALIPATVFVSACYGQASADVALSNGVQLTIVCNKPHGTSGTLQIGLEPASGNSFYRTFKDENNIVIFVYQLQVERTSDGDNFRITAKPAGDGFAARFPNADAGKPAPTLSAPSPSPLLASGDKFVVGIPEVPGVTEGMTDTMQVGLNARGVSSTEAAAAPLRFAGLRVERKGQLVSPNAGATVAGRYVMFYIPGHGAYFLSAEPVESPSFAKIGVVEGTHLHFVLDNDDYDCYSDSQILHRADSGEVWVYHDPNYKPAGNWASSDPSRPRDEFYAAGSDSLRWWLP